MKNAPEKKRETLRSNIKEYIQAQIAKGIYQPGDRIVETQLARALNVSQAPVREAILELSSSGLLEERPYSGTFVRKLTPEDIEDIYNTRAIIDEYAASQAARHASDAQLEEMDALLRQMESVQDYPTFARMDIQFHAMVIDAAGSPSLKRAWENLRLVEWTGLSASITRYTLPDLMQQHREIYRLLKQHAEHSAGAYMYLHIKNFGEELSRHFAEAKQKATHNCPPRESSQESRKSLREDSGKR